MKPRLGFLGTGWIGRHRLEAVARAGLAKIVALAEPAPEILAEAALLVPDAKRLTSMKELFGQELDGLIIATPSAQHAEQTIAGLEAGCAVFCQKPLGRSGAEVRRIVESARAADRLLGVDLSYRFTNGMQKIRELIRGGELGDVFAIDLVFHNAYGPDKPWFYDRRLSGGGCVIDLGIHLVDAALWATGESVAHVSARLFSKGEMLTDGNDAVEDYAAVRLDLSGGAVANLACSWRLHAGRDAVIEAAFFGTRGGAAMRNVRGSFFDFETVRFDGTKSEVLASPPEAWGGRAIVDWVEKLARGQRYDPEIERQFEVAETLDAIYGRTALMAAQGR